ncbi:MAG: Holliday junction resolvase-like protein [Candidatus Aenigmarchaeota archaeon]|nr:hypothetical protein [Candidatus Aenigmarchaeota archaeon]MDW8149379.1 Holliday junction resolvase-like protein [Candidatus Aenigmarchaeota archaeon]
MIFLILSFLLGALITWLILKFYYRAKFFEISIKVRDFIAEKITKVIIPRSLRAKLIEAISKDVVEQFAPFTEKFKEKNLNALDSIYLGEPIDFIVFDGWKEGNIKRIVFLEIKSRETKLTKTEERIKEIIEKEKDKIEFEEISFTKEKIVSEDKIREILESSSESVEIKNKILKEVSEKELKNLF